MTTKIKWTNAIPVFIGVGVGLCVGIWGKLPDKTIDVFFMKGGIKIP